VSARIVVGHVGTLETLDVTREREGIVEGVLSPDLLPVLVHLGVLDLRAIKKAADEAIAQSEDPCELLIEVSMAHDLEEVLRVYGVESSSFRPTPTATAEGLARLRRAIQGGQLALDKALIRFEAFGLNHFDIDDEVWIAAAAWGDSHSLAVQGVFSTVEEVGRGFLKELSRLETELRTRA
jgi:hypothetical protein